MFSYTVLLFVGWDGDSPPMSVVLDEQKVRKKVVNLSSCSSDIII